jgi:hypothetical protein
VRLSVSGCPLSLGQAPFDSGLKSSAQQGARGMWTRACCFAGWRSCGVWWLCHPFGAVVLLSLAPRLMPPATILPGTSRCLPSLCSPESQCGNRTETRSSSRKHDRMSVVRIHCQKTCFCMGQETARRWKSPEPHSCQPLAKWRTWPFFAWCGDTGSTHLSALNPADRDWTIQHESGAGHIRSGRGGEGGNRGAVREQGKGQQASRSSRRGSSGGTGTAAGEGGQQGAAVGNRRQQLTRPWNSPRLQ